MPLDIMPAPAAPSGVVPPGPAEPLTGLPPAGADALLFGLLLAQTVGQGAPTPRPVAAPGAPALHAALGPASTPALDQTAVLGPVEKKDDSKAKDKASAEALVVPSLAWVPPAPLLPASQTVSIPGAANATSPPLNAQNTATTEVTNSTLASGKVMDTVPNPAGELLSSPIAVPPADQAGATLPLSIPKAPPGPPRPAAALPATVPATPLPQPLEQPLAQPLEQTQLPSEIPMRLPAASISPRGGAPPVAEPSSVPVVPAVATSLSAVMAPSSGQADAGRFPVPAIMAAHLEVPVRAASPVGDPATTQPTSGPAASVTSAQAMSAPVVALRSAPYSAPGSLQKPIATADNQAGKSAVSKSTGGSPLTLSGKATRLEAARQQTVLGSSELVKEARKARSASDAVSGARMDQAPAPATPPAPAQVQGVAPMPATDQAQMLGQVEHGITAMTVQAGASGPQQVTLQLHPKDWGQLKVAVTMTPTVATDGRTTTQVVAHVVAEHASVKAALESGRTELHHALRQAGLHLDRLTVTVQAAAAGSETSAGGHRPQSRGGEGWGGGQSTPHGAAAQGGSSFGGHNPSPSGAFAQGGQSDRRPPMPQYVAAAGSADPDLREASAPAIARVGRVDTRA